MEVKIVFHKDKYHTNYVEGEMRVSKKLIFFHQKFLDGNDNLNIKYMKTI